MIKASHKSQKKVIILDLTSKKQCRQCFLIDDNLKKNESKQTDKIFLTNMYLLHSIAETNNNIR